MSSNYKYKMWIVDKALGFASNLVEKLWAPHPVQDVKLFIKGEKGDRVQLKFGVSSLELDDVRVDPVEAYTFEAKLREAQERASRQAGAS